MKHWDKAIASSQGKLTNLLKPTFVMEKEHHENQEITVHFENLKKCGQN